MSEPDFFTIIAERITYDYNGRRYSGKMWGPGVAAEDILDTRIVDACPRPAIRFYDDGPRHPDDCPDCPTIKDALNQWWDEVVKRG